MLACSECEMYFHAFVLSLEQLVLSSHFHFQVIDIFDMILLFIL